MLANIEYKLVRHYWKWLISAVLISEKDDPIAQLAIRKDLITSFISIK